MIAPLVLRPARSMEIDVLRPRNEPQLFRIARARVEQQRVVDGGVTVHGAAHDEDRTSDARDALDGAEPGRRDPEVQA